MAKTPSSNPMGLPSGRSPLSGEGPSIAGKAMKKKSGGDKPKPGEEIVKRRHVDWILNHVRWHWLMDSYEGGQRYRNATYGPDRRGRPSRNLIRHKREYPDALEFPAGNLGYGSFSLSTAGMGEMATIGPLPGQLGADPATTAQDDDYEMRRARTVPNEFLREAVEIHLGKIYDQDVRREGPPELEGTPDGAVAGWWDDVTGSGRSIDDWIRDDVAPLLMVLGCLDVCFDRPAPEEGMELRTRRDEIDAGQDTVVASYILPENMLWWREDYAGNYVECLVREFSAEVEADDDDEDRAADDAGAPDDRIRRSSRYRHWTKTTVALYGHDGEEIEAPREHNYPFVPIRRLIDLKRHRTPMIGKPRYEAVAYYQREYYNRDSELILSDTLHAHPILCVAEDFLRPDSTLPLGPGYAFPMKKLDDGAGYQAPVFISPPKDPADSLRQNLKAIEDMKDRRACLTKPAGVTGTTGGTVSQSGYSKAIDEHSGSKMLGSIAKVLARVEREVAEFALMCILRRPLAPAERRAIRVVYPSRFQLKTADELLQQLSILVPVLMMEAQSISGEPAPPDQAGGNPPRVPPVGGAADGPAPEPVKRVLMPTMIGELLRQLARAMFQGGSPALFDRIDAETKAFLMLHVLPEIGQESDEESMAGSGSAEQAAALDRMGQTGATMAGGSPPALP